MSDRIDVDSRPLQIDIVSDVVCPWCYVGKRNLEAALAQRPDIDARVHWRPYQLDPTIPPQGYDRRTYMERKFGDRVPEIHARISGVGKDAGIDFAFERIGRSPNTLDAHRVIRWAHAAGLQDRVVETLFRAFFIDGEDIGDQSVLTARAQAAGMDEAIVRKLLEDDADRETIEAEIETARSLGVTGVPFFIVDQRIGLSGAQPAEVLSRAFDKALESQAVEVVKGL